MADRRRLAASRIPALIGCLLVGGLGQAAAARPTAAPMVAAAVEPPSTEARAMADWVVARGDAHGLPFVVIDKVHAQVVAFDALGALEGATPALLGAAHGDVSPPGLGALKLADIAPAMRITPAGRFEAGLGRDLGPSDVLWVDYDDGLALHRVVTGNADERRLQRLATPTVVDNRISYGCINVPARFFDSVIEPLFRPANGIVYILPETTAFGSLTEKIAAHDAAR